MLTETMTDAGTEATIDDLTGVDAPVGGGGAGGAGDGTTDTAASGVRLLSLWQPWASLIAWGDKRIETRGWPTDYRGPVAIHATKTIHADARQAAEQPGPIADALAAHAVTIDAVPLGAIVAVADLVECVEFDDDFDPGEPERHFGDFSPGRFGFRLANVRPLGTPVECPGARGLHPLADEAAGRVTEQLARQAADSVAETPVPADEAKPAAEPTIDDYKRVLKTIEAQADRVIHLRVEWEDAKEVAAAKKKAYDVAAEDLTDLIARNKPGNAPLFEQPAADDATQPADVAEPAADPDAWKAEPVTALGLPDSLAEKLSALRDVGEQVTVGDVAAWAEKQYEPPIKLVGEAKRQLIDDALVDFHMKRHPGRVTVKPEATDGGVTQSAPADGAEPSPLPADAPKGLDPHVRPLVSVSLTAAQVRAAHYPHILTSLQNNSVPECKAVVTPFGNPTPYIAVGVPAGLGGTHMLLPLLPKGNDDGYPDDGSPFTGGLVTHDGAKLVIGPAKSGVLVQA